MFVGGFFVWLPGWLGVGFLEVFFYFVGGALVGWFGWLVCFICLVWGFFFNFEEYPLSLPKSIQPDFRWILSEDPCSWVGRLFTLHPPVVASLRETRGEVSCPVGQETCMEDCRKSWEVVLLNSGVASC